MTTQTTTLSYCHPPRNRGEVELLIERLDKLYNSLPQDIRSMFATDLQVMRNFLVAEIARYDANT